MAAAWQCAEPRCPRPSCSRPRSPSGEPRARRTARARARRGLTRGGAGLGQVPEQIHRRRSLPPAPAPAQSAPAEGRKCARAAPAAEGPHWPLPQGHVPVKPTNRKAGSRCQSSPSPRPSPRWVEQPARGRPLSGGGRCPPSAPLPAATPPAPRERSAHGNCVKCDIYFRTEQASRAHGRPGPAVLPPWHTAGSAGGIRRAGSLASLLRWPQPARRCSPAFRAIRSPVEFPFRLGL